MKALWIILYLLACIALGATADALNSVGVKTIGHLFNALEVGLLISGGLLFKLTRRNLLAFFLAYVFLRVAGFDYIYNLVAGESWDYIGTSNWWDQLLTKQMPSGLLFGRIIFLIAGISIPIKELR